jgi:hypothetical protein
LRLCLLGAESAKMAKYAIALAVEGVDLPSRDTHVQVKGEELLEINRTVQCTLLCNVFVVCKILIVCQRVFVVVVVVVVVRLGAITCQVLYSIDIV